MENPAINLEKKIIRISVETSEGILEEFFELISVETLEGIPEDFLQTFFAGIAPGIPLESSRNVASGLGILSRIFLRVFLKFLQDF